MSPMLKAIFGTSAGVIGVVTLALISSGGDPEVDPLPTPPPLAQNDAGYYFATLCVEVPATPPREECRHLVTKSLKKAQRLQKSGAYVGGRYTDIAGHPASNTVIWGNPRPGRPRR